MKKANAKKVAAKKAPAKAKKARAALVAKPLRGGRLIRSMFAPAGAAFTIDELVVTSNDVAYAPTRSNGTRRGQRRGTRSQAPLEVT